MGYAPLVSVIVPVYKTEKFKMWVYFRKKTRKYPQF